MNGPSAVATLRKVPVRSAVRWLIVGLIAVATVINYIDRNALAVMWPEIAREVGASAMWERRAGACMRHAH